VHAHRTCAMPLAAHHLRRDSVEAHPTSVFAALAVSRPWWLTEKYYVAAEQPVK